MKGKIFQISSLPIEEKDSLEPNELPAWLTDKFDGLCVLEEHDRQKAIDTLEYMAGERDGDTIRIRTNAVKKYLHYKYEDFKEAVSELVINNTFEDYCSLGVLKEALDRAQQAYCDDLGYYVADVTNGYVEAAPLDTFIRLETVKNKKFYIGSVIEYRIGDEY